MTGPPVLDLWEAETLLEVFDAGRTHPLVLDCGRAGETPPTIVTPSSPPPGAPARQRLVAKVIGLPEVRPASLGHELFGNLLARELGIDTPRPALVDLTLVVAAALTTSLRRSYPALSEITLQPGLGAACQYIRPLRPVVPGAHLTPGERAQAAALYAFDLMAQNPDRRADKPNCALNQERLIAFDFESAFSFVYVIGNPGEPWEVSKHGIAIKHLFHQALRGTSVEWTAFLDSLERTTKQRLCELADAVPLTWRSTLPKILDHLDGVKANRKEFELELHRSLT
jgi:hypothetical protein